MDLHRFLNPLDRPSMRQVMQQVTVLFDGEVTAMRQGQCGEANDARKVGLYLMKRLYYLT